MLESASNNTLTNRNCYSVGEKNENFKVSDAQPNAVNASSLSSVLPALTLTFRRDCAESFKAAVDPQE